MCPIDCLDGGWLRSPRSHGGHGRSGSSGSVRTRRVTLVSSPVDDGHRESQHREATVCDEEEETSTSRRRVRV